MRGISPIVSSVITAGAILIVGVIVLTFAYAEIERLRLTVYELKERWGETFNIDYVVVDKNKCRMRLLVSGAACIRNMYLGKKLIWSYEGEGIGLKIRGSLNIVEVELSNDVCDHVKVGDIVLIVTCDDRYLSYTVSEVVGS